MEASVHPRSSRVWNPLARALGAAGDRWTLMIALALAPGRMRLTHLHRRLPGVSTGVLERYLQQMVALGLVTRTRFKEMPPRVEFELTQAGSELLPVAEALARWGMRHAWWPPAERERIDVDVLFALLPALLGERHDLPAGSLELEVTDAEPPVRRRYAVRRGRLAPVAQTAQEGAAHNGAPHDGARKARGRAGASAAEGAEQPATAEIVGDAAAWSAALGPQRDLSGLEFGGEEDYARRILAALPHGP